MEGGGRCVRTIIHCGWGGGEGTSVTNAAVLAIDGVVLVTEAIWAEVRRVDDREPSRS